jgi:glyoxylase-like metal-dependent hydrolase (beta-lactamase superfamily II)
MRKLTTKPVTHVVNTHWHDDHHTGNAVYREAWPGVKFVGQTRTAEEMLSTGAKNRAGYVANAAGFAKRLRQLVAEKKTLGGAALTEQERLSYLSDAVLADKAATEWAPTPVLPPNVTLEDKLVLDPGKRTVEVLYLGRGHTGTDLLVHLPAEGILLVGDLVSWPVPLVGSTSHPAEFATTLRRALDLRPRMIVPGHGPVWRNDDSFPRLVLRLLESIRDQAAAAVARGETLEQARGSVDLAEFRKAIAGDSQGWGFAFDNYVSSPAVAVAYEEAQAKHR